MNERSERQAVALPRFPAALVTAGLPEEIWRKLFERAEWGIVFGIPGSDRLELMNPAFARMHGYSVAELTGQPIQDVFAPECRADLQENIRLAHARGHHVWESWHIRRDGTRFPVRMDVTAIKDAEGEVLYRLVNVQDISEQHQTEARLKEREAMLEQAQAQAHLGSWRLDIPNNLLEWTAENYRIFGVPVGTPLSYEDFLAMVHPDDRAYVDREWQAGILGRPYDIQHRILVNGEVRWVRERAELEFLADGSLWRGVGTTQDITELKQREQELLRSRQDVRELAAHNEKIREAERSRIAREIHDELGQYLTALRMDAAMLNIRFGAERPALGELIGGMKETIDTTIGVVRNLAAALRPAALDMGLYSAAEWLLAGFEERTGIKCMLDMPEGEALLLDDEQATAVFRILQESLTNIARHAQASMVRVHIERHEGVLEVDVDDNGIGFAPEEVRTRKTFGLMGIRERVLMFGGESRIDSAPMAGTILRVRIPLTEKP